MSFESANGLQAPFISQRLKLIISRTNAPVTRATKAQRGKVFKSFANLPDAVFFLISSQLEPTELLNLARVSKDFRAALMSPKSVELWHRVLKKAEHLPECPKDLTEPQYASLVFDTFCMGCGSHRGVGQPDYNLRLRLCKDCTNLNIIPGNELRNRFGGLPYDAFPLLPSNGPDHKAALALDSKDNNSNNVFFLPEARIIIAELDAWKKRKQNFPKEYEKFVFAQQQNATRMMNEGLAIRMWFDLEKQRPNVKEIRLCRRQRLLNEMSSLGWQSIYFPQEQEHPDTQKWNEYLNSSEWDKVRPSMEQIYLSCKRNQLMRTLGERLETAYIGYRARQSVEVRQGMPPFADLMYLPCMMSFMREHFDDEKPCAEASLESLFLTFRRVTRNFLLNARQELLECMIMDEDDFIDQGVPIPTIRGIEKAKVLFLCTCNVCDDICVGNGDEELKANNNISMLKDKAEPQLRGYPDIVCHWVDNHADLSWEISPGHINCTPEIIQAASDVLEALGLDKECRWEQVRAIGGLVCQCGHPGYLGALTFERLVYHVHSEREWYAALLSRVRPAADSSLKALLVNGHGPGRLPALIRRAQPEDEQTPLKSKPKKKNKKTKSSPNPTLYCQYCYRASHLVALVEKGEEAYHIKMTHGRVLTVGDFSPMENLTALYGEMSDWEAFELESIEDH